MRRAAVLALAALVAAPAAAATRGYQVGDFARLRVEGPFDVHVRTGVAPGARATGPQALIDRVIVEQHGDTLVIRPVRQSGGDWSWGKQDPLIVDVATHRLDAADLIGSGSVAIDRARGDALTLSLGGSGDLTAGDVDVATLRLLATGSGDLAIRGHARKADALLTGSGSIRGAGLVADTLAARLVGSGSMALAARHDATVTSSGSGDVVVSGPAACTVNRTGSGDVRCGKLASSGD